MDLYIVTKTWITNVSVIMIVFSLLLIFAIQYIIEYKKCKSRRVCWAFPFLNLNSVPYGLNSMVFTLVICSVKSKYIGCSVLIGCMKRVDYGWFVVVLSCVFELWQKTFYGMLLTSFFLQRLCCFSVFLFFIDIFIDFASSYFF